eukprot:CAMPEP_0176331620 /NCGR_PEP_ID=MMETSP0121_2-20121125/76644_1 /TAXON_ID=160619 /ORGANISM="Kryptoperidinium foliaceum, Strain CCMP 1326" /LENGTH=121 /DNA_ID=CAMNT_0017674471 /DNA_START=548 /DNA_END=914 /DNA_ORIENTATION=+
MWSLAAQRGSPRPVTAKEDCLKGTCDVRPREVLRPHCCAAARAAAGARRGCKHGAARRDRDAANHRGRWRSCGPRYRYRRHGGGGARRRPRGKAASTTPAPLPVAPEDTAAWTLQLPKWVV